jgi:hypothetical protein
MLRTRALLAAAAVAAAVAVPLTHEAAAAAPCAVAYQLNRWDTGFTAAITVTNQAAPVTAWTLTWSYGSGERVTSAWNATVTQSGGAVTARSVSWNGSLATGGSASFGVQGTHTGATPTPADFALNGVPCRDAGPTPTASPTTTTPSPTASPTTTPTPTGTPTPTATLTTSPTPTGPPPAGDGFEDQPGGAPTGGWTVSNANCSGAGTATIDTTVAHSGSKSLRIDGAAGYCNHVFVKRTAALPGSTRLYARFWVRHTTALPDAHIAFVALKDSTTGKDLRIGGQNQRLQWNRESDDATLPAQSPTGVAQSAPLPTNTWTCVEIGIDGVNQQTWLNGTEVPGLRADGVPTADIDGQWGAYRPSVTDLRLGWESYGVGADTLWYDDVAVSTTRPGC